MTQFKPFYRLDPDASSLVVDCRGKLPALCYRVAHRVDATSAEILATLSTLLQYFERWLANTAQARA